MRDSHCHAARCHASNECICIYKQVVMYHALRCHLSSQDFLCQSSCRDFRRMVMKTENAFPLADFCRHPELFVLCGSPSLSGSIVFLGKIKISLKLYSVFNTIQKE